MAAGEPQSDDVATDMASLDALPGELVDALSEAVAWPPDRRARADSICGVVQRMYETAEWVHRCDHNHDELVSLRRLVAAANAHWLRMCISDGPPSPTL